VPVDDDFRTRTDAVSAAVDDATALVVGVAGTTEYGRVDPIPELTRIAHETGARMHVDAAWGGFVLPFTDGEWSFDDAAVDTLTIDPHKFGQAAVPAGGLLARDAAALDALAVDTPYLETRSRGDDGHGAGGAGVAGAVAAMEALWPDGRDAVERATAKRRVARVGARRARVRGGRPGTAARRRGAPQVRVRRATGGGLEGLADEPRRVARRLYAPRDSGGAPGVRGRPRSNPGVTGEDVAVADRETVSLGGRNGEQAASVPGVRRATASAAPGRASNHTAGWSRYPE